MKVYTVADAGQCCSRTVSPACPPCPASAFILRVCLNKRSVGREKDVENRRKEELCNFHFQFLIVKHQGSCYCLLNVINESDPKRGGEVGGQRDADRDSSVER